MPGTLLIPLCAYLINTTTLIEARLCARNAFTCFRNTNSFTPQSHPMERHYYYPHFTEEDTETQRGEVIYSGTHGKEEEEPGLEFRQARCGLHALNYDASSQVGEQVSGTEAGVGRSGVSASVRACPRYPVHKQGDHGSTFSWAVWTMGEKRVRKGKISSYKTYVSSSLTSPTDQLLCLICICKMRIIIIPTSYSCREDRKSVV